MHAHATCSLSGGGTIARVCVGLGLTMRSRDATVQSSQDRSLSQTTRNTAYNIISGRQEQKVRGWWHHLRRHLVRALRGPVHLTSAMRFLSPVPGATTTATSSREATAANAAGGAATDRKVAACMSLTALATGFASTGCRRWTVHLKLGNFGHLSPVARFAASFAQPKMQIHTPHLPCNVSAAYSTHRQALCCTTRDSDQRWPWASGGKWRRPRCSRPQPAPRSACASPHTALACRRI